MYGWGYVAITLDRRLPHLLLDAKANDNSVFGIKTSNLPVDLARDQRLSLGGEFDDKFTLYAPSDYGRDAFYIFAPDLMALFIDRLGTFDVEIIDDTMFVYGSRFDLLDPRTYEWLLEVVDTVVARTVRRTERYRDDFALLESDPADPPSRPVAVAAGRRPRPANDAPVFALGGDGPPVTASNTVAGGGRRLRRRRWGSVVRRRDPGHRLLALRRFHRPDLRPAEARQLTVRLMSPSVPRVAAAAAHRAPRPAPPGERGAMGWSRR